MPADVTNVDADTCFTKSKYFSQQRPLAFGNDQPRKKRGGICAVWYKPNATPLPELCIHIQFNVVFPVPKSPRPHLEAGLALGVRHTSPRAHLVGLVYTRVLG